MRFIALLFIALLFAGLWGGSLLASNHEDFTEMDIDELMRVQVFRNPATALTSHIHQKGDWMLGYQYTRIDMQPNLNEHSRLGRAEVLTQFPVVATKMAVDTHAMQVMYAPTDDLTLMMQANFRRKQMRHRLRSGAGFTTAGSGWSDTTLLSHYVAYRDATDTNLVTVRGGLSLPSGSIHKKDDTPAGYARLPYAMQMGSGTTDLIVGMGYQHIADQWLIGAGINGIVRTRRNQHNYRLGDRYLANVHYTRQLRSDLTVTLSMIGARWGRIQGADAVLDAATVATADPKRQKGERIDAGIGFELYLNTGTFAGQRLVLELEVPLHQDLNGPQLAKHWQLLAGWQWIY